MKEFHSNSQLHAMAIMLLYFAIYTTENILKKKKNPKSDDIPWNVKKNFLIYMSKIWETHNLKISFNPTFATIQIYGSL